MLVLDISSLLDVLWVDFDADWIKFCTTVSAVFSVVTDLGVPDRESSTTDPVSSNLVFKL